MYTKARACASTALYSLRARIRETHKQGPALAPIILVIILAATSICITRAHNPNPVTGS